MGGYLRRIDNFQTAYYNRLAAVAALVPFGDCEQLGTPCSSFQSSNLSLQRLEVAYHRGGGIIPTSGGCRGNLALGRLSLASVARW
jgi:hypothetical protein